MSNQSGWRWCRKCLGLFYAGSPTQGVCPGGGSHDGGGSGHYAVEIGQGGPGRQAGWRWCLNCQGMFYSGHPDHGVCSGAGGAKHYGDSSSPYAMAVGDAVPGAQPGWRWCRKCQGMYYGENAARGNVGVCPAGLSHMGDTSAHYAILWDLPLAPPPVATSKTFEAGPLTTNHPLGAYVKVVVDDLGTVTFSGSMHNSGFDNIQGTVAGVIMTAKGMAYTVLHSGHTEGTIAGLPFGTPNRDHSWIESTVNPQIKADWDNVSGATFTAQLSGDDLTSDGVVSLLDDTLADALSSLGTAAATGIVALFS